MRNITAIVLMLPMVLGGCSSMLSGLGGDNEFSCKAPDGVSCSSLSKVHADVIANRLPTQHGGRTDEMVIKKVDDEDAAKKDEGGITDKKERNVATAKVDVRGSRVGRTPSTGEPIRTRSKVLRIWVAPWEDADGDLHDQSYIYVVANHGHWNIEHSRQHIIDRYRPTFIRKDNIGQSQGQPVQQTPNQVGGTVMQPSVQMYGGKQGVRMLPDTGEGE